MEPFVLKQCFRAFAGFFHNFFIKIVQNSFLFSVNPGTYVSDTKLNGDFGQLVCFLELSWTGSASEMFWLVSQLNNHFFLKKSELIVVLALAIFCQIQLKKDASSKFWSRHVLAKRMTRAKIKISIRLNWFSTNLYWKFTFTFFARKTTFLHSLKSW